jgi:glycosyltransferase involved in cell wall biosynthesis
MYQPKVSVLTLTYNDERFIGACLESVLAQTYPHWQMVITDDGSTDATPEIIARYRDPRIVYIRQEHRGIEGNADKYNRALERTDGELVACLAGDDAWPPYRLEKMVPLFQDESVVMCFGRGRWINEKGEPISELPVPDFVGEVMNRPVGSVLRHLLVHNFIPSYAALMSRRAIARMGGFQQPPGVLGVDSPTCMHLEIGRAHV